MRRWRLVLPLVAAVVETACAGTGPATPAATPGPPPCVAKNVTVISPRAGAQVPHRPIVEGTVQPACGEVWLVVHPLSQSTYWVQPKPTVDNSGSWRAQIYIGEASGNAGEIFELIAFAGPKEDLVLGKQLTGWPKAETKSDVISLTRQASPAPSSNPVAGNPDSERTNPASEPTAEAPAQVARPSEYNNPITTQPAAPAAGCIAVASPANGSQVGKEAVIRGRLTRAAANAYVWVLTRRDDFAPLWWPQRRASMSGESWEGLVVFGGPQDIGRKFDIAAIKVDKAQHLKLHAYWTAAMRSGHWEPIEVEIPECAHQIKVSKDR